MPQLTLYPDELDKGVLPPICMICGESASHSYWIRYTWAPMWTHGMLIFGCITIWPWLIMRIVSHRAMEAYIPLCLRHKNYWMRRRMVLPIGLALTFISLLIVMFGFEEGRASPPIWALLIPFALFVGSLLLSLRIVTRGTRVIQITDQDITFEQVDVSFVSAVEKGRREYETQSKQWLHRHDPSHQSGQSE